MLQYMGDLKLRKSATKKVKFQIGQINIILVLKQCQYDIFCNFKRQNDDIVTNTDLLLQRYKFVLGMPYGKKPYKVHYNTCQGLDTIT